MTLDDSISFDSSHLQIGTSEVIDSEETLYQPTNVYSKDLSTLIRNNNISVIPKIHPDSFFMTEIDPVTKKVDFPQVHNHLKDDSLENQSMGKHNLKNVRNDDIKDTISTLEFAKIKTNYKSIYTFT